MTVAEKGSLAKLHVGDRKMVQEFSLCNGNLEINKYPLSRVEKKISDMAPKIVADIPFPGGLSIELAAKKARVLDPGVVVVLVGSFPQRQSFIFSEGVQDPRVYIHESELPPFVYQKVGVAVRRLLGIVYSIQPSIDDPS